MVQGRAAGLTQPTAEFGRFEYTFCIRHANTPRFIGKHPRGKSSVRSYLFG